MQVQRLITAEQLDEIGPAWEGLARGVPFSGHRWLATWWRHYGAGHELAALAVYGDNGRLMGLAPWYLAASLTQGRVLLPLGSGEVCSDHLTILCQPEREHVVAAALADYLLSPDSFRWDMLRLGGIDAGDSAVERLVEQMTGRGSSAVAHCHSAHRCWRLALPPTWEELVERQSKSHRKQLRRLQSRVLDTSATRLIVVDSETALADAWPTLVELHQRRRTALGEPGCFASPRFAAFHREIAGKMLAAGRLRLFVLERDGRPVAAEYQLAGDRTTYAYQSGVDPERLAEEPGRLITMATIQRAIAEGQGALDFLRGDEPYKAHWRTEPTPTYDYRIVPNRAGSRLRHKLWLAGHTMKSWLKPVAETATTVSFNPEPTATALSDSDAVVPIPAEVGAAS